MPFVNLPEGFWNSTFCKSSLLFNAVLHKKIGLKELIWVCHREKGWTAWFLNINYVCILNSRKSCCSGPTESAIKLWWGAAQTAALGRRQYFTYVAIPWRADPTECLQILSASICHCLGLLLVSDVFWLLLKPCLSSISASLLQKTFGLSASQISCSLTFWHSHDQEDMFPIRPTKGKFFSNHFHGGWRMSF